MKNFLPSIMKKSDGFMLVHVLFVITLIFILISSSIANYHSEVHITNRQLEYVTAETLFQMAREQYIGDQSNMETELNTVSYQFPQGKVTVTVNSWTESHRELRFKIEVQHQEGFFSFVHVLSHAVFEY